MSIPTGSSDQSILQFTTTPPKQSKATSVPPLRFAITTEFKTTREKELEYSERRAHAARVASSRKRQNQGRKGGRTVTIVNRHHAGYSQTSPPHVVAHKPVSTVVLLVHSDPFNSNGQKITPEMNLIMSFMRDVFYPALYFNSWSRKGSADAPMKFTVTNPGSVISGTAASRDWNKLVWSLSGEGLGLASLAACSAMAPQLRQVTYEISLGMRAKSVKLLRQRLQSEGEAFRKSQVGVLQVFWLFEAEALQGNKDVALIHGNALRDAVTESFDTGIIDMQMLLQIIWADTDLAAKMMRRTVFSMEWVTHRLSKIWGYIKMKIPMPPDPTHLDLDPTVTDETLRPTTTEIRLQILVTQQSFNADECKELGVGDLTFTWIGSRSLIDYGRLTNRFIDLETEAYPDANWSDGNRHTQACLVLAAMLVHRCLHALYINGVDIRDTSPAILTRLKIAILSTFSERSTNERLYYAEAHLWTLYLASITQRRLPTGQYVDSVTNVPALNFGKMLANQANFCGVRTWSQMEATEHRFIKSDMIQPSGLLWFEDVLGKYTSVKIENEFLEPKKNQVRWQQIPVPHPMPVDLL